MRKFLILTSLVAFGLAGAANATVAKPMAAPAKTSIAAKNDAKADKVEARHAASRAKHAARANARQAHKVASHAVKASKSHAKPAATHG